MNIGSRQVTINSTSTLVSKRRGRKYFSMQNNGANNVTLHFGDGDAVLGIGVIIKPDQFYDIQVYNMQQLSAIAETGATLCTIVEG